MAKLQKITVINPTKSPTASIIFFHGSGSSGDEAKQWFDSLSGGELKFPHIKMIFPTAPAQPYTPHGGKVGNVWFNRKSIDVKDSEEVESMNSICKTILEVIDSEVSSGIPPERIVVGGFSMGGALAMLLSYIHKPSLAGCFAMSSFLNVSSIVYDNLKAKPEARRPPLLQFHGTPDDIIPIEWGQNACKQLKELGVNVSFVTLDDAKHELTKAEVEQWKKWVLDILPEK